MKHSLYPGCVNMSLDYGDDKGNSSSSSYEVVCSHYSSSLGHTWDYIVGLSLLCIIIPAIVLNSFVIWSFAARRKTIVSMDYYILTLAISDLCSPVFAYPLAMMSTFSHRWIFGETGCVINGFLGFFFGIVDIFILSVLSVTRYICVCHPMAFSRLDRSKVMMSLAGVLVMSALWAVFPLCGWGAYDVEPFGTSCTLQWSTPDRAYITCVFTSCLILPLIVMFTSYGCVLHDTSVASRRLRKYCNNKKRSRRAKQEIRLIKITILMTACFLLAWLPYAIVAMMSAYIPGLVVSGPTSIVPTLLAKTSHLTNPIVYFTMNTRFAHLRLPFCHDAFRLSVGRPRATSSAGSSDSQKNSNDKEERLEFLEGQSNQVQGIDSRLNTESQHRDHTATSASLTSPAFQQHDRLGDFSREPSLVEQNFDTLL